MAEPFGKREMLRRNIVGDNLSFLKNIHVFVFSGLSWNVGIGKTLLKYNIYLEKEYMSATQRQLQPIRVA